MIALGVALLIIGMILSLVGGVMFVVVAFRASVTWGLLVLFVPFANIVFLVKYWPEAKKSFFINLGGAAAAALAAVVLVVGGISAGKAALDEAAARAAAAPQEPAAASAPAPRARVKPAPAPAPAAPAPEPSAVEPEPVVQQAELDEAAAFEKLKEAPNAAPISENVAPSDLPHYIGQRLLLVDQSGHELRGTLLSVEPRMLRIQRELSGGSVRYDVARADVKQIRSLN